MKLRNLKAENPNYSEDSKIALFRNKMDTAAGEKYDWLIEYRVQHIIEGRLKIVIDKTPHDVLAFAQTEIDNLNRLFENTLNATERRNYCTYLAISEFTDYTNRKTWEVDVITRYKQYLEKFIADGCILETDQPIPDDEELVFRDLFNSLEGLTNNLLIEYKYFEHGYDETYGEYNVISVAGCPISTTFLSQINDYIGEGINNLKVKLRSSKKNADNDLLIDEIKQMAYKYKDVIANGFFHNAKFQGNIGWQLAFNDDAQVSIQHKVADFIKAWDTGISELLQKIILIEVNLQEYKPTAVSDNPLLSFKYNGDNFEDAIGDLFNSLKKNNFIDDLTTKSRFRNIFTGKQVNDKVDWLGGISTLSYFVKKLVEHGKIDSKADYWKIAQLCFSNNGGSFTTEQLKQAKKPAQKKADIIDRLTSNL